MKITVETGYRAGMAELAEGLGDLMADLEDVRDEAQEAREAGEAGAERDAARMDEALALLARAADLLEGEA